MSERPKLIVVTGAHSHLGAAVVSYLIAETDYRIACIVTPWVRSQANSNDVDRIQWLTADLTKPFDERVTAIISEAHRVLHFAWVRGSNRERVSTLNQIMADQILDVVSQPARLVLISSTAASPKALSTYARAKWRTACRVRERGGIVAVCGLVVSEPPFGPDKLLQGLARIIPIGLRLSGPPVSVYTVDKEDFLAAMVTIVRAQIEPDTYKVFAEKPIDLNRMLAFLECKFPRPRLPVHIPVTLVISAAHLARFLRVPMVSASADKVLTFVYKDRELLSGISSLPDTGFRPYSTS